MDKADIDRAASLLAEARRTLVRVKDMPAACRPRTIAEAHAIQDAVMLKIGAVVGGYKAAPPAAPAGTGESPDAAWANPEGIRGCILEPTIKPSPAVMPSNVVPQCGVEAEIAFRFRQDMPPRGEPYTREEIAAVVDAYPAIEVVSSRYASPQEMTILDKLADCVSNGGFVYGSKKVDWRHLRFDEIRVKLTVNGTTIVDQAGGHPKGDPFAIVEALVEMMRTTTGVKAGQFVTCGSHTGLPYFKPGDVCKVEFEGLGEAQVTFSV